MQRLLCQRFKYLPSLNLSARIFIMSKVIFSFERSSCLRVAHPSWQLNCPYSPCSAQANLNSQNCQMLSCWNTTHHSNRTIQSHTETEPAHGPLFILFFVPRSSPSSPEPMCD